MEPRTLQLRWEASSGWRQSMFFTAHVGLQVISGLSAAFSGRWANQSWLAFGIKEGERVCQSMRCAREQSNQQIWVFAYFDPFIHKMTPHFRYLSYIPASYLHPCMRTYICGHWKHWVKAMCHRNVSTSPLSWSLAIFWDTVTLP